MGAATKSGRRDRTKTGRYRRCRRGLLGLTVCPGYTLTRNGVEVPHRRCGGDGWIKVGERKSGRPGGRGRRRARVRNVVIGVGAAWFATEQLLGAAGRMVCVLAVVVFFVLRVVVLVGERAAR